MRVSQLRYVKYLSCKLAEPEVHMACNWRRQLVQPRFDPATVLLLFGHGRAGLDVLASSQCNTADIFSWQEVCSTISVFDPELVVLIVCEAGSPQGFLDHLCVLFPDKRFYACEEVLLSDTVLNGPTATFLMHIYQSVADNGDTYVLHRAMEDGIIFVLTNQGERVTRWEAVFLLANFFATGHTSQEKAQADKLKIAYIDPLNPHQAVIRQLTSFPAFADAFPDLRGEMVDTAGYFRHLDPGLQRWDCLRSASVLEFNNSDVPARVTDALSFRVTWDADVATGSEGVLHVVSIYGQQPMADILAAEQSEEKKTDDSTAPMEFRIGGRAKVLAAESDIA